MCATSTIMDNWRNTLSQHWPQTFPSPLVSAPAISVISREEFEGLRREVSELRTLLEAAQKFDRATGQPDCEDPEKVAILRRVAEMVGVDLSALGNIAR